MEYMTVNEAAEKWGVSSRRVHTFCGEGRIKGAARLCNAWAIPQNADKPSDAWIKSGKYIKNKAATNLHKEGCL
jgi:predicted site-specific integrase-resolvase